MGDDAKVILLPESLHPTFIGDFIVPAVALSIGLRSSIGPVSCRRFG